MTDTKTLFNGCLYFTVGKLSRAITKMAEEEFQRTGLSPTYGFILMLVHEHPRISPTKLGKELHLTPSTITRLLDKLEVKALITRETMGKNSHVNLTSKGEELLSEVYQAWRSLYVRYAEVLGEETAKELTRATDIAGGKLL